MDYTILNHKLSTIVKVVALKNDTTFIQMKAIEYQKYNECPHRDRQNILKQMNGVLPYSSEISKV